MVLKDIFKYKKIYSEINYLKVVCKKITACTTCKINKNKY